MKRNEKPVLWRGKHLRFIKSPGSTDWVGRGQQAYTNVRYNVYGPGYSKVPNRHGVDTSKFSGNEGPELFEHRGRLFPSQLAEVIEFCKAIDAAWSQYEQDAEEAHKVARAEKQAAERFAEEAQALAKAERERRERFANAGPDLLAACNQVLLRWWRDSSADDRELANQIKAAVIKASPPEVRHE